MLEKTIAVNRDVQSPKKIAASRLRDRFTSSRTLVVNLVSSPGSGKTALLEATFRHWENRFSSAVLVGDLETDRDAKRLEPFVPVEQLTTGGACHLELSLVEQGLKKLPQNDYDFLFIENIGNLVCPASHDLAEHLRVVLLSVTEGDDKPGKYPKMYRTSDAMIVTKTDLLPYVPFDINTATLDAQRVKGNLHTLQTSATQGVGIEQWCRYLQQYREELFS